MGERWVQNGIEYLLLYLYDENGAPIGLHYRTSDYESQVFDSFFFEKNVFGDIIGVYNSSGKKLCTYTYDAWGVCYLDGVSGVTLSEVEIYVAVNNPFRYRGYYYDVETGLYYLQSRYYNPEWGRFLNADGYVSTGAGMLGYNMFAYCNNNPVMFTDPTGDFPFLILVVAVVAIALPSCAIKKAYDNATTAKTLLEMYEDLEDAKKAKQVVANEVYNKSVNPDYNIDVSNIYASDIDAYVQQITSAASLLDSTYGTGTFPAYEKMRKKNIPSYGAVPYSNACEFESEISGIVSSSNFIAMKRSTKDYLEKGLDIIQSTIGWAQ